MRMVSSTTQCLEDYWLVLRLRDLDIPSIELVQAARRNIGYVIELTVMKRGSEGRPENQTVTVGTRDFRVFGDEVR